jgi:uncharacterized protein (TIGR02231 family)
MKKLQFLIYFISYYSFAANDERLTAKISKVTVFQNQAQITSTVKGFAKAGNNTIIIENVSPNLNPQTIQVAGKGDIILMGTKFSNNFIGQSKSSPKMTQLTDSLRYINEELKMITYNQEALEREKDLLKANYLTGATTVANTADKVKAMADFFRIRMADINSNIIKNERLVLGFKEKSTKIQLQINELNEKKNTPSGEIAINISSKTRTAVELEITYIVNGAGWSPVYDIRVKDVKNPISLGYKANVWQQSGLDWNDVKLTLSTTNPSLGGNKPELFPQMVDIYVPQPPMGVYHNQKSSRAMESNVMSSPMPAAMADMETSAGYTTVTENTLAVSFEIALLYSIPNGGKPEIVDIQNYDLPASFKHFGLPKYDADAFLTADITGWEQYNLLPGKANVYFENVFVGETYILNNNVKDTLNLSLGRDKKINFKREIIRDYSSKKAIGSNIRESQAYRITIRNTKKEAVDLVVEDQIPVSKNSDIEVLDAEYKGAELNAETGKLTWKMNLKPSETKIIEVKYTVKYPKGKTVTGI